MRVRKREIFNDDVRRTEMSDTKKAKFIVEFEYSEATEEEVLAGLRDAISTIDLPDGDSLWLGNVSIEPSV